MSFTNYTVQLNNFSGPLDLLLKLIKRNKLDICDVNIAKITEDYLRYVSNIELSHHDANRFLEVAVKLILTKSQALLPDHASTEDDTNLEDLSEQLLVLQSYKNVAKELEQMQNNHFLTRPKVASRNELIDYSNLSLVNILNSFSLVGVSYSDAKSPSLNSIKRKLNTKKREQLISKLLDLDKFSISKIPNMTRNNRDSIMMFMIVLEFIRSNKFRVTNSKQPEIEAVK